MSCRDECREELKELLTQLQDNCEQVTIFIQSGDKCCKRTGCICDVDDCFVVLLDDDDPCERTYILLDCICAVRNCVEDKCGSCSR